ncbi:unknown [Antheraea pernyi nucleopolyhedrovirus]|uniref:Chitin-binding protein 2 n=2 Tax=Antheraea pernyi nuclear polyhedrosis virus TaxID=161494 RepID=Q1HH49_NPVAP|nr:hypothetical protein APNV_p048 [Antheraea pernyi nucleopolyhedrovirus]AWD33566.1 chitin-binding protein 2 [Antheraea proylei nucleopolyhedrovirus]BBD50501.1 chitin-binding protein 2 [Antheraea yamamai nucleopolyhedrovirus]BBD50653.1 chitin-binding protein 2 [Samia cynthia nucleopolyhedrovirus]ABF50285.1 unknown [Antheraea pernyi nucleopolyhedrovirus]ABQ12274.1 chitin-binding protein 2 [Antheraea pernyi nucleopolyhedrovirus]
MSMIWALLFAIVAALIWAALHAHYPTEDYDYTQRCFQPGMFGNVPSAYCNKYYLCAGGTAIPQFCPAGFGFDETVGQCVNLANMDCRGKPLL